jgi:outer membrane protein assembly factor BamB
MRGSSVCVFVGVLAAAALAGPASALGVPAAAPSSAPIATWQAQGRVSALAIANGVVYMGGSFTSLISHGSPRKTITRNHLAAVSEATGAPLAWNPRVNGAVHSLRVVGGRLYVGGSFTSIGGRAVRNLAAVSRSTGHVITTFRGSANGEVDALAASATKLYLGGTFSRVDGFAHGNVGAVALGTGAAANGWAARTNGPVHTLLVGTGSGRVYIGGHFRAVDGRPRSWLAVVGAKKGSNFAWATAPLGQVWALALSPQGQLYVGVGGHEGGQLDAYNAATGARHWQRFADGDVQTVSVAGSEVLAGGHFLNACGDTSGAPGGGTPWVCTVPVQRERFFATDSNGTLQPWNPGGNSLHGVWALRSDATHIAAGGDFTIVNGTHQARYAEFLR